MLLQLLIICFFATGHYPTDVSQNKSVTVHFKHIANGATLEKGREYYTPDRNVYSLRKVKYYISHVSVQNKAGKCVEIKGEFLIDAFAADSISFDLPEGKYSTISFMLGLDSATNVGGAKAGTLDPLNDMYWAWNTGFIHFKMEGTSSVSTADLNRIQYHIGGFSGANATQQQVCIKLPKISISKTDEMTKLAEIQVNLDEFWQPSGLITNQAMIMNAGQEAVSIASRLPAMFSLSKEK